MTVDIEELFRGRVSEEQVAKVLQLIATMPNKRRQPIADDLPGTFDCWFDGGAGRIITGWNEYELADGTRVTVGSIPALSVTAIVTELRQCSSSSCDKKLSITMNPLVW